VVSLKTILHRTTEVLDVLGNDFKYGGYQESHIWTLDVTYQKSKKSVHARPWHQEPGFSSFCMETEVLKLKINYRLTL
jgi:hypothetical protein